MVSNLLHGKGEKAYGLGKGGIGNLLGGYGLGKGGIGKYLGNDYSDQPMELLFELL